MRQGRADTGLINFDDRRYCDAIPRDKTKKTAAVIFYVIAFSVICIVLLPSWEMVFLTDYFSRVDYRESDGLNLYSTLGMSFSGLVALMFIQRFVASAVKTFASIANLYVIVFFMIAFMSALYSVDPVRTFVQAGSLLFLFLYVQFVTHNFPLSVNFAMRCLVIIIPLYIALLLALHGWSHRTIGGIQPNTLGKLALVAVGCSVFFGRQHYVILVAACALLFGGLVSSRGSIVFILVFVTIFALMNGRSKSIYILGGFALLLSLLVFIVSPSVKDQILYDVLAVDDPVRGMGSGFLTNRDTHWQVGFSVFLERPLLGYGFKTRTATTITDDVTINAHSGFINILLDVGLIGGVVVFFFLCVVLFTSFQKVNRLKRFRSPYYGSAVVIESGCFAFVSASLVFFVIEPIYFSPGLSFGAFLLVLLFSAPGWARFSNR